MRTVFHYFIIIFLFHCATYNFCDSTSLSNEQYQFQIDHEWSYINFTWRSQDMYLQAVRDGNYIPENNAPTGLKIYKNNIYLSIPKFRNGVPATLAYISSKSFNKINELLTPFPNWEMNDDRVCSNLQSVQSMEIDTNGIMWVIDGVRISNNKNCPPKLILIDLNNVGNVLHSYIFTNEICLQDGGFLNDIVIDETDGGFAYITDNSDIDPGLIVYSQYQNRAWKIRDRTMFYEPQAANFLVENEVIDKLAPIDGIALSPKPFDEFEERIVFYSALTGFSLFAISNSVLKNEELCKSDRWRRSLKFIGAKQSQSDGIIIDNSGNLYYTQLSLYGVGKWNIHERFSSFEIIDVSRDFVWPDGFAMDENGYLYLISNYIFNYINTNTTLYLSSDIKFRIYKLYTGTRSYLYPIV